MRRKTARNPAREQRLTDVLIKHFADGLESGAMPMENVRMLAWFVPGNQRYIPGTDTFYPGHCGSIGCIGGWCSAAAKEAGEWGVWKYIMEVNKRFTPALDELFYYFPPDATKAEIVHACRAYLGGVKHPWRRAQALRKKVWRRDHGYITQEDLACLRRD